MVKVCGPLETLPWDYARAPAARQLSAHGALGRECAAESEMRRENVSEYTVLYTFFPYTDERLDTLVS